MIDLRTLIGSTVKDEYGNIGALYKVSLPWVTLRWYSKPDGTPIRFQRLLRSDPYLFDINIMTADYGWVPAAYILGAKQMKESIQSLITELKQAHSPYKDRGVLKVGPYGGWKHNHGKNKLRHLKRDYWDCKCNNYKCLCKGDNGENKKITIKKDYKTKYNKAYKKWLRGGGNKNTTKKKTSAGRKNQAARKQRKQS